MTHERHRTQRFLLPLWKYSCSINARGRNAFSVRMELETIEAKSTQLTSRLQRCDPKKQRRQRLMLPLGKYYCSRKARGRNSFTVSKELKTIGTKSTHLISMLQRCDPKMAKKTTSHASFGEILLLHKSEKQKLLHFQNKVSKDRDHKLLVQCRIYKHVTH